MNDNMEVAWADVDILDGDGRVTAAGELLLHRQIHEERLAVVTLLGTRATSAMRRRLIAEMLGQPPPPSRAIETGPGPGSGVTLLANVSYLGDDYRVLILDVGDASSPVVGALCALSSLVLSACDTETAIANALPAFPPFQQTLQLLQREQSPTEICEALPVMLTIDFSRDGSLQRSSGTPSPTDPLAQLADLARLKTLGIRTANSLTTQKTPSFFDSHARVKKIFGAELTGELLLSLLQSAARDATESHEPDLSSAWDEFVEHKCTAIAEDAMTTYVDCIQSSLGQEDEVQDHAPPSPIELEAMEKLHEELQRLALDVFHSGTCMFKSAPSRRVVRSKLKSDLKKRYTKELATVRTSSRQFCERVRTELWQQLSAPLLVLSSDLSGDATGGSSNSHSFREALHAITSFDAMYMDGARGPEKMAVLNDFHRKEAVEIFRQLEGLVSQRMTDAHLRDLREQLESDFDAKKEALVVHFKQQEAQLRAGITQQMEMQQKLHQARHSRVKMEENETKRLRDEVIELRAAKADLESRHVVLDHEAEHAKQQNQALESKVRDLETAVRHEMASRAELVDTLAATIKSSQDREQLLQDQIGDLQVEVNEKASRIENELRELTLQQKKTSEEKNELQKKLNEFFLRVTALPPAMQQHLFCGDAKEVGFADALSSYMSG